MILCHRTTWPAAHIPSTRTHRTLPLCNESGTTPQGIRALGLAPPHPYDARPRNRFGSLDVIPPGHLLDAPLKQGTS